MSEQTTSPEVTPETQAPEVRRPSEAVMDIYSAGVIPFNWMRNMPQNYYPYFLTNVLMLQPAVAGTVSLISRLMGIFMQPIAGGIIDRSNPKKGKYATWIKATVPLGAVLTVVLFLNFTAMGLSPAVTAVITTILYTVATLVLSFGLSVHVGLFAVLSPDPVSRVKLTTRRAAGQSASQITMGMLAMPLVVALGGPAGSPGEGKGYLLTVALFAVVCVIGYLWIGAIIKPWDPVASDPRARNATPPPKIKELVAIIFKTPPLAVIMLSDTFRWASRMMLTGFAIYLFRYVYGNVLLMAAFMTSMNFVSFGFTLLAEPFTKKFGKDNTYLWGNVLLLAAFIFCFLFGKTNLLLFIIVICIGHIGYGPSAAQPPAYYAECDEWNVKKTGKSAKTMIMSVSYFAMQIGVWLSGILNSYSLAAIGFDASKDVSAAMIDKIFAIGCLVPAALLALSILIFLFYKAKSKKWYAAE